MSHIVYLLAQLHQRDLMERAAAQRLAADASAAGRRRRPMFASSQWWLRRLPRLRLARSR